jgi:hypothetical protein
VPTVHAPRPLRIRPPSTMDEVKSTSSPSRMAPVRPLSTTSPSASTRLRPLPPRLPPEVEKAEEEEDEEEEEEEERSRSLGSGGGQNKVLVVLRLLPRQKAQ